MMHTYKYLPVFCLLKLSSDSPSGGRWPAKEEEQVRPAGFRGELEICFPKNRTCALSDLRMKVHFSSGAVNAV